MSQDLLFAGTDVWRQLILGDQVAGLAVVAGFIQTDAPRRLGRRLGSLDGDLSQACPLAAGGRSGWRRRGRARSGPRRLRQAPGVSPLFSSISGVRASLRPPERRLGHGPIASQPGPVDAHHLIIFQQPLAPELMEHARPFPLPPSGGGPRSPEQIPVALSALPCMPVRGTSRMASIASGSGTLGLWQPRG